MKGSREIAAGAADPTSPAAAAAPANPAPPAFPAGSPDLAVRALGKSFPGRGGVLAGVSFEVARGEAVAVIGPNGCGKSTLLRCCLRLIEPDTGRVRLLGREVGQLRRGELRSLRSRVGFVFQRHHLVPRLSVLTNVIHGSLARRRGPRAWFQCLAPESARREAMACLTMVGLPHLAASRADRLSGGESQRVAIARALMQRPQIVLADEPVASLDPRVGEEVMDLFVRLIRQEGITLVFVSHDLSHALAYSDRIVALKDGRGVLDAPSRGLTPRELRHVYD